MYRGKSRDGSDRGVIGLTVPDVKYKTSRPSIPNPKSDYGGSRSPIFGIPFRGDLAGSNQDLSRRHQAIHSLRNLQFRPRRPRLNKLIEGEARLGSGLLESVTE